MTEWATDPRKHRGEECAFEAELAEASGDVSRAKELYREAARSYRALALATSSNEREGRSVIGISAVACFARAGDFGDAIDVAHRLLAQSGALTAHGRTELTRMATNYATLVSSQRFPTKRANVRRRQQVRTTFAFRNGAA
jgi:hypothetical protein